MAPEPTMSPQRQGEIALLLVKHLVATQMKLQDIGSIGRRIGNLSKATGVHTEELRQFAKLVLSEVFEQQMLEGTGP